MSTNLSPLPPSPDYPPPLSPPHPTPGLRRVSVLDLHEVSRGTTGCAAFRHVSGCVHGGEQRLQRYGGLLSVAAALPG